MTGRGTHVPTGRNNRRSVRDHHLWERVGNGTKNHGNTSDLHPEEHLVEKAYILSPQETKEDTSKIIVAPNFRIVIMVGCQAIIVNGIAMVTP